MPYDKMIKEQYIASVKKRQCQIETFTKADEISITPVLVDETGAPIITGDALWLRDVGQSPLHYDSTSFARAVCDIIIPLLRRQLERDERELAAIILHEEKESALDEEYGKPSRINRRWAPPGALPAWVTES